MGCGGYLLARWAVSATPKRDVNVVVGSGARIGIPPRDEP
jgi:hypothetical protein